MTNYDDLFVDEVMRECWERKAQVISDAGGWESYNKHLAEGRAKMEAQGWKFGSPQKLSSCPSPSLHRSEL